MNNTVELNDFLKISIHTGTVLSAKRNEKSKNPAYVMDIDFGSELGIKKTSAQITDYYTLAKLPGKQVVAVTNFPALRVAGVRSEVLVLGVVTPNGVCLLKPDQSVADGLHIA